MDMDMLPELMDTELTATDTPELTDTMERDRLRLMLLFCTPAPMVPTPMLEFMEPPMEPPPMEPTLIPELMLMELTPMPMERGPLMLSLRLRLMPTMESTDTDMLPELMVMVPMDTELATHTELDIPGESKMFQRNLSTNNKQKLTANII